MNVRACGCYDGPDRACGRERLVSVRCAAHSLQGPLPGHAPISPLPRQGDPAHGLSAPRRGREIRRGGYRGDSRPRRPGKLDIFVG